MVLVRIIWYWGGNRFGTEEYHPWCQQSSARPAQKRKAETGKDVPIPGTKWTNGVPADDRYHNSLKILIQWANGSPTTTAAWVLIWKSDVCLLLTPTRAIKCVTILSQTWGKRQVAQTANNHLRISRYQCRYDQFILFWKTLNEIFVMLGKQRTPLLFKSERKSPYRVSIMHSRSVRC